MDSAGRLDLTRALVNDTDFYRCTGVDVAGGSGSQLFRVEVVAGDGMCNTVEPPQCRLPGK